MADVNGATRIVDYYTDAVLPALAERLDAAFPEFGWRRDTRGWVATNEETTHRMLGVRAERVVAHGPAPRGFLIHGGEPMLWTAYVNGGQVPRGADFVSAVRGLAERAGVDASPLDRAEPRDRRADLLEDFFQHARDELGGARGEAALAYLESRGIPGDALEASGLGLVPAAKRLRQHLSRQGYDEQEIENSGLLADRRWPGRICGPWRDERRRVRTVWARTLNSDANPGSKYLYLRGSTRTGLPPYGLSELLSQPVGERRELVLVEGLLDVHQFHARDIPNVVALGGTSTTPQTFERLAQLGIKQVTICLDRDAPGRAAAARVVERAVRANQSPAILVLDPEHLSPSKDPDAFLRERGADAWLEVLTKRECAVTWRVVELADGVTPESPRHVRREALLRAGRWLGGLPARLALEQEDAVRDVAERWGYSPDAVGRAFRARFWAPPDPQKERRRTREARALEL